METRLYRDFQTKIIYLYLYLAINEFVFYGVILRELIMQLIKDYIML
jgi:hypothetical protein